MFSNHTYLKPKSKLRDNPCKKSAPYFKRIPFADKLKKFIKLLFLDNYLPVSPEMQKNQLLFVFLVTK
jgi:hypothetical protein